MAEPDDAAPAATYVTVTSGTSAIAGIFAQVDVATRDGSTSDMSPVD